MRILITGKGGKAGSWAVRAVQLGEAIGAEVEPLAEVSDCKAAQVVVGVKRIPDALRHRVHAADRPFVWDVVDAWPQAGASWERPQAMAWLSQELRRLSPAAVVWPTQQMQQDAGWTGPQITLPHHAWPKYRGVNVRHAVRTVGYEGSEKYLGRWRRIVQAECDRRGWRFVVNGDMAGCDIGVALRDTQSYPSLHWKPGTKLANLQALGLPALCSPESGCKEIANGSEYWIRHQDDITRAFNELSCPDVRSAISVVQQQSAPRIGVIAKDYSAWLTTLT